jgi:hypothetical protein
MSVIKPFCGKNSFGLAGSQVGGPMPSQAPLWLCPCPGLLCLLSMHSLFNSTYMYILPRLTGAPAH